MLATSNFSKTETQSKFEFIKDRLYYMPLDHRPKNKGHTFYFTIDDELVYQNFFDDFGPLNLAQVHRFCEILTSLLRDESLVGEHIVLYSGNRSDKRANAAFLICCFAIIHLGRTPQEAFQAVKNIHPPFPTFEDASPFPSTFNLTILDCLEGLYKGIGQRFVDFHNFNAKEYEFFEKVENGDLNWIVKDKFIAFAGPVEEKEAFGKEQYKLTPKEYIPYFKKNNVKLVIRLNSIHYDSTEFTSYGIKHADLIYEDGTCPSSEILNRFLSLCENEDGAVAVHCKAGLGRTGTCIGSYIIKHYGFSAAETIGWLRICRPGSVIGPQQHFLHLHEQRLLEEGKNYRLQNKHRTNKMDDDPSYSIHHSSSIGTNTKYSKRTAYTQGDALRLRKLFQSSRKPPMRG